MGLEFVGVGDLHLDGKLSRHLPDLNSRILCEVKKVLSYARRNGVPLIVFYGDICETPELSTEASRGLLQLLLQNADLQMIFLLGNHDRENSEKHSMQLFLDLAKGGVLPNLKVIETPTTLFKNTDTPLRLLPWPSLEVKKDCLNVIHEEVAGSVWDYGKSSTSSRTTGDCWCVAGHIHTSQKVGQVHYSGTLYQTTFGEKPKKYFHHVSWVSGDEAPLIKRIPHEPSFKLVNHVVSSLKDLSAIDKDPNILYKVFVQAEVTLETNTFAAFPNVVKVNSFKTKAELTSLIQEELRLDEEFEVTNLLSVETNLKSWLLSADVEDKLRRKAYRKFVSMFRDS